MFCLLHLRFGGIKHLYSYFFGIFFSFHSRSFVFNNTTFYCYSTSECSKQFCPHYIIELLYILEFIMKSWDFSFSHNLRTFTVISIIHIKEDKTKIQIMQDSISYALYSIKTSAALVLLMCLFPSPYLGLLETIFNVIIKSINLFINLNPN